MFIIILPVHISVNRMKQNQERLLLHSFRISGFFKYAFLKFPKFQHRVVFSKLRCSTTPRYSSPSESLPFPHDSSNLFKTQYPMQSPECRFIFSKKMGKTEFWQKNMDGNFAQVAKFSGMHQFRTSTSYVRPFCPSTETLLRPKLYFDQNFISIKLNFDLYFSANNRFRFAKRSK